MVFIKNELSANFPIIIPCMELVYEIAIWIMKKRNVFPVFGICKFSFQSLEKKNHTLSTFVDIFNK